MSQIIPKETDRRIIGNDVVGPGVGMNAESL
jgi:hypothetical protein